MADYLSYGQYQELGGTLDEMTFNDYAYEAQIQIDWYTFNRLEKFDVIPEKVQRCMFYLIKLIEEQAKILTPGASTDNANGVSATVASQSNDGVSISYNILSASEIVEQSAIKINQTINKYLGGLKDNLGRRLMYRGLYPYE